MQRVHVRLFAALAEGAGCRAFNLEMPDGARAADVRFAVQTRYPRLHGLCDRSALAVNAEYSEAGRILQDGDEVALIPPVSGG